MSTTVDLRSLKISPMSCLYDREPLLLASITEILAGNESRVML